VFLPSVREKAYDCRLLRARPHLLASSARRPLVAGRSCIEPLAAGDDCQRLLRERFEQNVIAKLN